MTLIDNLPALRATSLAYLTQHGAALPTHTAAYLQAAILETTPPVWAVNGFEILYAELASLPGDGPTLCAQAAELVSRYAFYGAGDRAYAVLHTIKANLGEPDADTSVTAPDADPAYQV